MDRREEGSMIYGIVSRDVYYIKGRVWDGWKGGRKYDIWNCQLRRILHKGKGIGWIEGRKEV